MLFGQAFLNFADGSRAEIPKSLKELIFEFGDPPGGHKLPLSFVLLL
jgi:hypothetical protein